MRIAVSAVAEVGTSANSTAYFLRGVGGTVEKDRLYHTPYTLRTIYAITSAYALRPYLVRPHLCVRPTPLPSMPSPLRTPYALT